MSTLRWMGKGALPVGLLLSLVLLPGKAQAVAKKPLLPGLEEALVLLDSSSGPHLPEAVKAVRGAIGVVTHKNLFSSGPPFPPAPLAPIPSLTPLERRILEPPGGLYVLYNRHKVQKAGHLLEAARKQLEGMPGSPPKAALMYVETALKEVHFFLLLPFLF
jgi:hypothetical protein